MTLRNSCNEEKKDRCYLSAKAKNNTTEKSYRAKEMILLQKITRKIVHDAKSNYEHAIFLKILDSDSWVIA